MSARSAGRRDRSGADHLDQIGVTVRRLQPYQAHKTYLCPGCNQGIAAGIGHLVVVPITEPDLRRHCTIPAGPTVTVGRADCADGPPCIRPPKLLGNWAGHFRHPISPELLGEGESRRHGGQGSWRIADSRVSTTSV